MSSRAVGFLLVLLLGCALTACGNNKPFDSVAWLKSDARERGRMSQHLVDSKLLIGRSLAEAKQTLGEPEKDWGRVIQYHIDLGWPLKDPQHYELQVHLDSDRTVTQVKIVD